MLGKGLSVPRYQTKISASRIQKVPHQHRGIERSSRRKDHHGRRNLGKSLQRDLRSYLGNGQAPDNHQRKKGFPSRSSRRCSLRRFRRSVSGRCPRLGFPLEKRPEYFCERAQIRRIFLWHRMDRLPPPPRLIGAHRGGSHVPGRSLLQHDTQLQSPRHRCLRAGLQVFAPGHGWLPTKGSKPVGHHQGLSRQNPFSEMESRCTLV
mmetsp:Transcript_4729/g.10841  ORF Transcript_4729/g.10841 Transcript_4729/m.10841 type:complete len:206 (-) Transcript_4729:999-1616(-)